MTRTLLVRETATHKIVRILDLSGKSVSEGDRALSGLLRQMNTADYYVEDSDLALVATPESALSWSPEQRAEYRAQYDRLALTGSFSPSLPMHPDEVDRIAEAGA